MNEVYRVEKKYLISQESYFRLHHFLEKVMMVDPNSINEGYTIRSLYFDSLDDRDFHEKEDGIEIRRKIRLRIYLNDPTFGVLEMKKKVGEIQKKTSLKISLEDCKKMLNGEYDILLKYDSPFAMECYSMMQIHVYRPKSVVTYERIAYIAKENKIRITFDHHIRGSESNYNIFSREFNENYLLDPSFVVLEVKYNGFLLGYIKDFLNQVEKEELSVGKYSLSRIISKNYLF